MTSALARPPLPPLVAGGAGCLQQTLSLLRLLHAPGRIRPASGSAAAPPRVLTTLLRRHGRRLSVALDVLLGADRVAGTSRPSGNPLIQPAGVALIRTAPHPALVRARESERQLAAVIRP